MTRVMLVVLYGMFPVCAPCPFRPFVMFLGCLVADPWEPGNGITPSSRLTRFVIFRTGLSTSYRNRYVAVASFSDMLPWHHFCFAAVAPFSFRHGDQMLHNMLMLSFS